MCLDTSNDKHIKRSVVEERITWPPLDITQRESPALAMSNLSSRTSTAQAVHPEVGSSESESGSWSVNQNKMGVK